MNTLIVNLYGAPGVGKSTGATYIFSRLKMDGYNAEYVSEYAKDATWENNFTSLNDQMYVYGQQHYKMYMLLDKVDVIVTDSPHVLSLIYNPDKNIQPELTALISKIEKGWSKNSINYYINRLKDYNPNGRTQTFDESVGIESEILKLLNELNIKYSVHCGCKEGYDKIYEDIKRVLQERQISNKKFEQMEFNF